MTTTREPDLFDFLPEYAAQRAERAVDPLVCLRDEVSEALEAVVYLRSWRTHSERTPGRTGRFFSTLGEAGLWYDRVGESRGFEQRPRHLYSWEDLTAAVGADPRRAGLTAWVESLPEPRWSVCYRPHELWPEPEKWHPSYITNDHARTDWPERIAAWRTVQAILTDAIGRLA